MASTNQFTAANGGPVAIDIALEPDETMAERSLADNARLLKNFPPGYALDETHHAHITMLQRFVPTADRSSSPESSSSRRTTS
ncbi:MAG TPA: hypothetical protein VFA29_06885 [Candidatus Baltobacteraceae bacterium]|jgi:hypothetical protein|nr:hypothetical protein [Candidatus Baltobacteraceae bacterium]